MRRFGLLAIVTGLLVAILGLLAPAASASPTFHPQTRVAAIEQPTGQVVGAHDSVLAVQGRERAPTYDQDATGSSVAAEGETTSIDALSASGAELDPADAGGQLTRAGRAFAKHSNLFPSVSGGPAALNEAGQNALDEILTNPGTTEGVMRGGNFAGGKVFIGPNGIGAVFSPSGEFEYFGRFGQP